MPDTTAVHIASAGLRVRRGRKITKREQLMPWTSKDATRHTQKAATPKRRRQWAKVANKVLAESGDEGKAVRIANAAVRKACNASKRGKKDPGKRAK